MFVACDMIAWMRCKRMQNCGSLLFFFLLVYIGLCELMLYLFVMIVKWFFFLFFLSFILSLSMFFMFLNNWLYQQWNVLLYWSFCALIFFFDPFIWCGLSGQFFFFLSVKSVRPSIAFYLGNRYTVTKIPYNFIHDFCFMWAAVVYFLMLIYGVSFVKGFEC